jgi:uncharacterized membrane protein
MLVTGIVALAAGLILVQPRFRAASGAGRLIVLGPLFYAVSFAIFAAEHFTAARDLMGLVPKWLPAPLFWVYFVGAAWLASAISLIIWRHVRWSATLTALLLLVIVATIDLPMLPRGPHTRFFWILTVRETCFASGALVLAGSLWPRESPVGPALMRIGRTVVGATMIFYAIEHFLFPLFVPGVPLEKPMPASVPAPALLSYVIGITEFLAGIALLIGRGIRIASAGAGLVLVLLTAFFYVPVFLTEMHTSTTLAVEGLNYIGDTLLFAATVLLAGFGADGPTA